MTKYLVFVWFSLQILHLSDVTEGVSCKFKELRPTSAYVKASVEQPRSVDGCRSLELTEHQQEIYVVGLANWNDTSDQVLVVDLYLQHIASNVSSSKRIFVLASTQPVTWRLHSGGLRHTYLGKFLVSDHSHVSRDPHLKFKTRRLAIPFSDDVRSLESWARKKWGAVTTLAYLRQSVTWIRLPVGQATDASQLCHLQVNLSNVTAGRVDGQLVQGTFREINETAYHRDIHIIELLSVASFSLQGHQLATVELNIESVVSPPRKTQLLLILKSHQPVKWKVTTRRLRRTIDIITDQSLDSSGINTGYFRVSAERLSPYSCRSLLTWATEKYGPPVSYTFAKLANKLDLTVDTKGWTDFERLSTTPLPLNEKQSTLSVTRSLKHSIVRSLSLSCKQNGMKIALWKYSLRNYPLSMASISLLSPFCQATDVGAKFVLAARYSDCGTRKQITRDGASVFTNAVVVRPLPMSQDSRLKSLAEPSSPIVVNVSCHYLNARHDQPSNVDFEMKLFRDRAFQNEIAVFPAKFSMADQLFVEVGITSGAQLNVLVNNCSLEPNQTGSHLTAQRLIVDGCPADKTIEWIDEKDISTGRSVRHFAFDLLEHWDMDTVVTLKCSVTICTLQTDNSIQGIAQCSSDQPNCDHQKSSTTIRDSITLVTRGPLILLSVNKPPPSPVIETPPPKPVEVIVVPTHVPMHSDTVHSTCSGVVVVEGVTTGAVIGISFAAFTIGVMLMSSLWYIHTRTGPKKRIGLKSSDSRGTSIPGSGLSSIQRDTSMR